MQLHICQAENSEKLHNNVRMAKIYIQAGFSDYSNLIFLHTKSPHMVGELLSGDVATTPNKGAGC